MLGPFCTIEYMSLIEKCFFIAFWVFCVVLAQEPYVIWFGTCPSFLTSSLPRLHFWIFVWLLRSTLNYFLWISTYCDLHAIKKTSIKVLISSTQSHLPPSSLRTVGSNYFTRNFILVFFKLRDVRSNCSIWKNRICVYH